jgi:hypothetical protein
MIEVLCPHCTGLETVPQPKDKGFEQCRRCSRGFEVYPDGTTVPTPLDQAVGGVEIECPIRGAISHFPHFLHKE